MKKSDQNVLLVVVGFTMLVVVLFVILFVVVKFLPTLLGGGVPSNELSASQRAAFNQLTSQSQETPTVYAKGGVVRYLTLDYPVSDGQATTARGKADSFLHSQKSLLDLRDPAAELSFTREAISQGRSFVHYLQVFEGIPVVASDLVVEVSADGHIRSLNAGYIPGLNLSIQPRLSAEQALSDLISSKHLTGVEWVGDPALVIFDPTIWGDTSQKGSHLVWMLPLFSEQEGLAIYYCDTGDGSLLAVQPEVISTLDIAIYDADGRKFTDIWQRLKWVFFEPNDLVFDEEGAIEGKIPDGDAMNAWYQVKDFYKFLEDKYNRDGYDANGGQFKIYVNVDLGKCPNAAWFSGLGAVLACDGVTDSSDVLVHEIGHAIVSSSADLSYVGGVASESGALNESFADLFAAFMDPINPWKISFDAAAARLIRDLSDPAAHGYPDHYSNLVTPGGVCLGGEANDGCAHINSTIHSKAYNLLAVGGYQHNVTVMGIGMDKVEQIAYHALVDGGLTSNSDFRQARETAIQVCERLTETNVTTPADCDQVRNAFAAVGVGDPAGVNTPTQSVPSSQPVIQTPVTPPSLPAVQSSTVLVLDASGSMDSVDFGDTRKIDSAILAGGNLLDVIVAENQALGSGGGHQVGMVDFNNSATQLSPLTGDIRSLKTILSGLEPSGSTAMASGLDIAQTMLMQASTGDQKIIILLSDGMPNVFLNGVGAEDETGRILARQEVLDLAASAGSNGICVNTVGFGTPTSSGGSLDEQFLEDVAAASGCGQYYSAIDAYQLANRFIDLRHQSLGAVLLQASNSINQGDTDDLGQVQVNRNSDMLLLTLNWVNGSLQTLLTDPAGRQVDGSYPGATISSSEDLTSLIVAQPRAGDWQVQVRAGDIPTGTTSYHAVLSTRQGSGASSTSGGLPWMAWLLIGGLGVVVAAAGIGIPLALSGNRRSSAGRSAANAAHLTGIEGPLRNKRILLAENGVTLGRGSENTIIIPDGSLSRKHASFHFVKNVWVIRDEGSKNGVFVNDRQILQKRLSPGDRIRIGNSILIFNIGAGRERSGR